MVYILSCTFYNYKDTLYGIYYTARFVSRFLCLPERYQWPMKKHGPVETVE